MTAWIRYLLPCILLCVVPGQVAAAIYTWVDDNGVRNYSNVIGARHFKARSYKKQNKTWYRKTTEAKNKAVQMMNWRPLKNDLGRSPSRYDHYISQAAFKHQIDPLLIKAIIKTESNFNQYAVSSQGAQGLMQLMPMTAKELRVNNPYDAKQNINGGTRYIKQLLDCYNGDLTLSLAAYNAGPSLVSRLGKVPRIPETKEYIRRVLYLYDMYHQGGPGISSIQVRKLVTVN